MSKFGNCCNAAYAVHNNASLAVRHETLGPNKTIYNNPPHWILAFSSLVPIARRRKFLNRNKILRSAIWPFRHKFAWQRISVLNWSDDVMLCLRSYGFWSSSVVQFPNTNLIFRVLGLLPSSGEMVITFDKQYNQEAIFLCVLFRASLIYINNCPMRCNTKQSIYYSASSLHTFRVSTTPIISSTQNCNYSLRYCAATSLQRGQTSLATLEGDSCTKIMTSTGGCNYSFVNHTLHQEYTKL